MAYCKNCGQKLQDEAKFCADCGTPAESQTEEKKNAPAPDVKTEEKKEKKSELSEEMKERIDINNNKTYSYFAYLGILVLIPILSAPNSKFARFHSNQGLILAIVYFAYSIISSIARTILGFILGSLPIVYTLLSFVLFLPYIALLACTIMGLINVSKGECKKLPVIGEYQLL